MPEHDTCCDKAAFTMFYAQHVDASKGIRSTISQQDARLCVLGLNAVQLSML
jgi:hypothetical protein